MNKSIPRHRLIEKETRTLPSGATFIRNRCMVCLCYWDTQSKHHKDEKEHHDDTCPLKIKSRTVW